MKKKVVYIFVFMLIFALLASYSEPNTYNVEVNKSYLNLRKYLNNTLVQEEGEVKASELEATIQYEYVQTASRFIIPSLRTETGSDRNITDDCYFIYRGVEYTNPDDLVNHINSSLNSYNNRDIPPFIFKLTNHAT